MIDQVMEQHPGITRLHVGGDEVSHGGLNQVQLVYKEYEYIILDINFLQSQNRQRTFLET